MDYEKIANDVENGFIKPVYLEQKIQYTSDKKSAEVCISRRHNLGDYLVMGIIALQHSINGKAGDILVYNENTSSNETIGVAKGCNFPIRQIEVDSSTYLQVHRPIEEIYQNLYQGEMKVTGIGLNISMALMMHFSELHEGIPECIVKVLQFRHFDDLDTAQKHAFSLIQKMTGAAVAGTYYAIANREY